MKAILLSIFSMTAAAAVLIGADTNGSFDRSLSVSGPVDLEVTTDSGGITIRPGSSSTVHVHGIIKAQNGMFGSGDVQSRIRELERNPPIEQSGNTIRIGKVRDRNLLHNISLRFEIETPADTKLRADADSGGIDVAGVHGPVNCKADSGGITVQDVGSDVHAQVDSGGIHIRNAKGFVYARADSGGIEAMDVRGGIDAETDSGSIHLGQLSAAPIHAKADSGGIRVKLVSTAGYNIHAESDSGNVSVPEMTAQSAHTRHHVEGAIRGGGPSVNLSVESGGITID